MRSDFHKTYDVIFKVDKDYTLERITRCIILIPWLQRTFSIYARLTTQPVFGN